MKVRAFPPGVEEPKEHIAIRRHIARYGRINFQDERYLIREIRGRRAFACPNCAHYAAAHPCVELRLSDADIAELFDHACKDLQRRADAEAEIPQGSGLRRGPGSSGFSRRKNIVTHDAQGRRLR